MMNDKNGKELKTGMIVKIEGGYFKADNGTFLVKHSPGDPTWSGTDYSLKKCNKKGEESESKYSTAFWPLMVTTNSRELRIKAREHNKENATIEIIGEVKTYRLAIKESRGCAEYEYEEIATEKRYSELLEHRNCEVSIIEAAAETIEPEVIEEVAVEQIEETVEEVIEAEETKTEIEIPQLNQNWIHNANYNSFAGTRGDHSQASYNSYANEILNWNIADSRKEKLLQELHKRYSEILKYEAQHVSVMVAGPAKYNSKKLGKGDQVLKATHDFCEWFKAIEQQVKNATKEDNKADRLTDMILFCDSRPELDPTNKLAELAIIDNVKFVELFEKLNPKYNWRKNSTIYKLYQKSKAGEVHEIKKEVVFQDDNLTAFKEGDRYYIAFVLKPKQQLKVALKSRKWWWNAYKKAWSTYESKFNLEWVENISTQYKAYV